MDPNVKDQLNPVSPAAHQGGKVEGAPIAPEQHVESSHPMPEVPQEVSAAGVQVVQTAPQVHHRMFEQNPEPRVELPQDQTPAWLEQQIKADQKALDNNTKDSKSWLGRLRIAFLEKLRAKKLDPHPTGV